MNTLTITKWSEGCQKALDFLLLILHPINIREYGIPTVEKLEKHPELRGKNLTNFFYNKCEGDLDKILINL